MRLQPTLPPADGWAFKNNVDIRQHRNLQDRLQAAHRLLDRSPQCPVVVDTMQNQSSQLYAALPERLYVIQEGRICYKVVAWDQRSGKGHGVGVKGAEEDVSPGRAVLHYFSPCDLGESFHLKTFRFSLLQNETGLHPVQSEACPHTRQHLTRAATSWLPRHPEFGLVLISSCLPFIACLFLRQGLST